jgi:hypothetical protein
MPKETMTPRERWLAVMNRQKPDRVPMDFWTTPEFAARLIHHLGFSRLSEKRLVTELNRPGRDPKHLNQARAALRNVLQHLKIDFVIHISPRYK